MCRFLNILYPPYTTGQKNTIGIWEYFFSSNTKHNPAPKKNDFIELNLIYLL